MIFKSNTRTSNEDILFIMNNNNDKDKDKNNNMNNNDDEDKNNNNERCTWTGRKIITCLLTVVDIAVSIVAIFFGVSAIPKESSSPTSPRRQRGDDHVILSCLLHS